MSKIETLRNYAHPEVLVDSNWVLQHHKDGDVRIAEVDYDPTSNYNQGHIPNSVLFDWKKDINDPLRRDILQQSQLEDLFSKSGISDSTILVLYGDFNNWFAAFAFWVFKYYRVKDVRILNGGRKKWIEEDKPLTKEVASFARSNFKASPPDETLRVYVDDVRKALGNQKIGLVDVRGPKEFTGEVLAPPEYPTEHAQRGGHIPGAANVPWAQAVKEDGTFKSVEELENLYKPKGITADKEIITYCRIGERSSHTWFVLKYLLGYKDVRNYDGSWTEWGNLIRTPIEK
ncbi:MAG: sulfurtransferase [Nitrososphaerota archaeon]|nr:sulfurtransferase [Nitrososphaerota archaeon]